MACALIGAVYAPAHAAGPYDGIYVNLENSTSYMSVHTNGNTLIGTAYGIIPASGILVTSAIGNVAVRQLNTWDLYQGSISGSTGTMSGQVFYNACNVSVSVNFNSGGATVVFNSSSNTLVGNSSGVNCGVIPTLAPNGVNFLRIF